MKNVKNLQIKRLKFIIGEKITGIFYLRILKDQLKHFILKKDKKKKLLDKVEDFYSEETRSDYLSFGIPYKMYILVIWCPWGWKNINN